MLPFSGENTSPLAETLTESFCERCGTRYEFQAPTRLNPLRKTRGLIGGLRNYLTSQDDLSDAMGDAMRSEEDNLASAQLDAFHESFNFCIDCRQYTCVNCWNDNAGRCRSCVPIPGTDDLAERLAASVIGVQQVAGKEPAMWQDEVDRRLGLEAWPTSDLPTDGAIATNGHAHELWSDIEAFPGEPEPEPVVAEVEPEPLPVVAEVEPEPYPVVAAVEPEPEPAVAEVEPEPEPMVAAWEPEPWPMVAEVEQQPWPSFAEVEPVVVAVEPMAAEVEPVRPLLRVVAWDEDSAYQVIEPEPIVPEPEQIALPEPVVAEVEPEPEPVVAEVEPEPEPVVAEVEPEPEPVVAEVEPEPETIRAPRRLAPISDTILDFPTRPTPAPAPVEDDRAAAIADSPELAARRAQLDRLGLGDPGQGPIGPDRAPVPYRSRGAPVSQVELARQAALKGSFWEASAREVASAAGQVGVQSCGQCGLSLSANARFCRRCGTRQAQSA